MALTEWITSFSARPCHSLESQDDCSSPTTDCKLPIYAAAFFPARCAEEPISHWLQMIPSYQANISVHGIDFPRLTDLYYNYKTAHGQMSGSYDFTGLGSDPRTMRGGGKVEVTNGDVFAIPIFGPLSGILNHIVPGSGYSIAHQAGATLRSVTGLSIRTTSKQPARSSACLAMAISISSMTSSTSMSGST